ncbi:hypothetical protein Tco_1013829, partial [Tanacetum coccineum]
YAKASLDRKSTTRGCQFFGSRLISWQCKKQTVVANSTTEAEYVASSSCCVQVLWIYIDNESTICIVKNPVFHSKTKHVEIRHHFIRDSNEKKLIQLIKIHTDKNVVDFLTKAFDKFQLKRLVSCGVLNINAASIATIVSAATITEVDLNLAQPLAELKSTKPKVTTVTAATTITAASTRPKAKGLCHSRNRRKNQQPTPIVFLLHNHHSQVQDKTELVEGSSKKAEAEVMEGSSKRVGDELEQEATKNQKINDDQETAELQSMMEVIPNEEEVGIDAIPLATKPSIIVD